RRYRLQPDQQPQPAADRSLRGSVGREAARSPAGERCAAVQQREVAVCEPDHERANAGIDRRLVFDEGPGSGGGPVDAERLNPPGRVMRFRPPRASRPAATLVETSVVISIALLFMFGIFEYGRFVMTKHLMENAAREGARWATVHTYDGTTAGVQD